MSGGSSPQKPPPPGEAAAAAVGTYGAGELMDVANAPTKAYANLYTNTMLDPYLSKTQTAVQNQAAMQAAQAQQDIQYQLDPNAYRQRQLRLQAATQRLGQLYGTDPNAFTFSAPKAYQTANLSQVPSLGQLGTDTAQIAGALRLANVNRQGANPSLYSPISEANRLQGGGGGYLT